jgi:hypothetical protein
MDAVSLSLIAIAVVLIAACIAMFVVICPYQ